MVVDLSCETLPAPQEVPAVGLLEECRYTCGMDPLCKGFNQKTGEGEHFFKKDIPTLWDDSFGGNALPYASAIASVYMSHFHTSPDEHPPPV